ncbi:hypothetical protein D3C80_1900620 [compost metagenome]
MQLFAVVAGTDFQPRQVNHLVKIRRGGRMGFVALVDARALAVAKGFFIVGRAVALNQRCCGQLIAAVPVQRPSGG